MATEDLKFKATLDDSDLKSGLKSSCDMIAGFAKKAGLAAVALASFDNAAKFAVASIEEFKKSEMTIARLGATIKAAGERTAYTSDALRKMATAMQGKSIFGDEAIMDAQRVMLTMQNISDDVIPAAIQAAANMADSEEDLASKAFALGKALESPTEGFTALKRSGVVLSDQTEKQIKQLTEEGRLREAQGILLAELEKRYGGVSDAMAKTAEGMAAINRNAIGDNMEEIGKRLLPVADLLGKMALRATALASGMLQVFNAERWAALTDGQKKYAMQFSEMTKEQLFTMRSTLKQEEEDMLLSGKYRVNDLRDRQDKIAALKNLLKEKVDAEKASLATTASNMVASDAAEAAGMAAYNVKKAEETSIKVKAAEEERLKLADVARKKAEDDKRVVDERIALEARLNNDLETEKIKSIAFLDEEQKKYDDRKEERDAKAKSDAEAEKAMRWAVTSSAVNAGGALMDSMVEVAKASGADAEAQKALRIGQIQMNAASASMAMWASTMSLPWPANVIVGGVQQAAIVAMMAVNMAQVNKQKFAQGGIVSGPPSGDTVQIQANGGEMMLNNQQQGNLFRMIQGGGGGGSTINISPVVKVDSGMTAGERDRVAARTADSVRNAIIDLVNAGRLPALAM